jgi:mono/diheme cytochrome c family protein
MILRHSSFTFYLRVSGRRAIALMGALILSPAASVAVQAQDFTDYSGKQLYMRFCAACHGASGIGDGVVAGSLRIMVPDLTRIAQRQGGKFNEERIRRIIDGRTTVPPHGTREMPVWGQEFEGDRSAEVDGAQPSKQVILLRLTDYIRSIQKQ